MDISLLVQKSSITGVAIGCDHAGEQVNREGKSRGGLKGITMSANSRNRQYLASPILDQLSKEMLKKSNPTSPIIRPQHHQLSAALLSRQGNRIRKLVEVLKSHDLGLDKDELDHIKNVTSDKV